MMRVLIVASNNKGHYAPFVVEQTDALRQCGCEVDFFGVTGKGCSGYLRNLVALKEKIRVFRPDVVHAHYGLSGLLANMQRRVPVVTTYHGSDINDPKACRFSMMAVRLSAWNIFVSKGILEKAKPAKKFSLLPCGVDITGMERVDKEEARRRMGLAQEKKYVLFAGAFDNEVKNATLAKQAVTDLNDESVELLELKGYSRKEVNLLLCAADVLLMTSLAEGSPQVIKEALAYGCPIVSVDVGDVKERVDGLEGCHVAQSRDPQELSKWLKEAILYGGRTEGYGKIVADGLDNRAIAQRLVEIYERVCHD